MAVRDQCEQQPVHQFVLADEHLADFGAHRVEAFLDGGAVRDRLRRGCHGLDVPPSTSPNEKTARF